MFMESPPPMCCLDVYHHAWLNVAGILNIDLKVRMKDGSGYISLLF